MQKLRMPFKKSTMVCGYKSPNYHKQWGYQHYGIDVSTVQGTQCKDHTVYASGVGKVVAAGWDSKLGGAICIQYNDVYNHQTGKVQTVIARYMHLKEVRVKTGESVNVNTPIGVEGKEGTSGYHLHLEFDTDISYPTWSPQVSKGLSFWVHGTDTTINPSYLLHQDKDRVCLPDPWADGWLNEEDRNIPFVEDDPEHEPGAKSISIAELKAMGITTITL